MSKQQQHLTKKNENVDYDQCQQISRNALCITVKVIPLCRLLCISSISCSVWALEAVEQARPISWPFSIKATKPDFSFIRFNMHIC